MKIILTIIGGLLILFGGIWILQGINVLPGSFMTGQTRWALYGGIAAIVGIVLIVLANKRKGSPPKV
jgi:drug/metabolite transporter superfamily protein YnfA